MATKPANTGRITGALYRPLVEALFRDTQTMVLGVVASTLGVLLTAYHTNSLLLYGIAAAMLTLGVIRSLVNMAYKRAVADGHAGVAESQIWERRYAVGAIGSAACLGLWTFVSMGVLESEFAGYASTAISMANLIGICGRNFPIARLFNWQLAAVGSGIVLGGVAWGGIHTILALFMIPFIWSVRNIATSQRENLFSALTERMKAEKLATQFDTALNNIPQAIVMLDSARRLEVANDQVLEGLGVDRPQISRATADEIIELLEKHADLSGTDASVMRRMIHTTNNMRSSHKFKLRGKSDRTIKMAVNPMDNGGVVATFEDITKEVVAATTIDHMARFDRLTGLVNRDQLQIVLASELEYRSPEQQCAALLINIDRFKQINDTLGHRKGDLVLQEVTKRLEAIVGEIGTCARYAGDEFAIILRSRDCIDFAQTFADQIIEALDEPMKIENGMVRIGCTIGIAFASRAGDTAELLLKQADMALHWAKSEGRGEWRVFNIALSQELERRRRMEEDLRVALERNEFELHYQPLVSVEERQITTCEALLRWRHAKDGLVSPGLFIPLAEELGLIEDIGAWVIQEATRTCATWPKNVRVAVNLSAVQFRQGDLKTTVEQALKDSGLTPSRLELEITESLMLSNVDETISRLNEFKEMGLRVSLDDFGTGYSSLSYMNNLPLDKVKIDRSFVEDLKIGSKTMTMVQGIAALGKELGLSVVVEGIEEKEQLGLLLLNAPVSEIQGFYFSKPLPTDEIAEMLDSKTLINRQTVRKMPTAKKQAA